MPDVIPMNETGAVRGPRPQKIGPFGEHAVDVSGSPIVAHEIDVAAQRRKLLNQPIAVADLGRLEARRYGSAEARRRQCHQVVNAPRRQLGE